MCSFVCRWCLLTLQLTPIWGRIPGLASSGLCRPGELLSIGRWLVVAFMLLLFVVSADWYNSKKAWVAMPSIVLAYSLLQALIAAVIEGLNALGGV